MVRTIDGTERRRLLAEAVWRVIRRDGFDAASVRAVAVEAGLSAGSVRHFFPTQQALHVFAMQALDAEATARSTAAAASQTDVRASIRAMLVELLPLTDRTKDDYLAHLQFIVRATVDPVIADTARQQLRKLQDVYRNVVDGLAENGLLAVGTDPEDAASRLGVLIDGLVLRLLTSPELLSREEARAQLERFLDDLGGGTLVIAAIVAAEVAFWVLLLGGLALRYLLRARRLSTVVLALVPLVDLALVVFVAVDIARGAPADRAHGIAAIYLGFTVAFGHSLIRSVDARFRHRFAGGPPIEKPAKGSREAVRALWSEWLRVLLASAIASAGLLVLIAIDGSGIPTSIDAAAEHPYWSLILLLGMVTGIWFLAGPAFAGRGGERTERA